MLVRKIVGEPCHTVVLVDVSRELSQLQPMIAFGLEYSQDVVMFDSFGIAYDSEMSFADSPARLDIALSYIIDRLTKDSVVVVYTSGECYTPTYFTHPVFVIATGYGLKPLFDLCATTGGMFHYFNFMYIGEHTVYKYKNVPAGIACVIGERYSTGSAYGMSKCASVLVVEDNIAISTLQADLIKKILQIQSKYRNVVYYIKMHDYRKLGCSSSLHLQLMQGSILGSI